jgi:hypothetical protein
VIKRLQFATRNPDLPPVAFPEAWRRALSAGAGAPAGVRPVRIAVCVTIPDVGSPPKHDGVGLEWFTDADHLERFEAWLETAGRMAVSHELQRAVDRHVSPVVVAEEVVIRGADWLEQRWLQGGVKLKHMAIARRAANLTQKEFSALWKHRAGVIRRPGEADAIVIPEEARGRAYVQNHPRPIATGDWAYDAFNEVYFDDLDGLRLRVDWFKENLRGVGEEDLVRESWFMAAREEVILVR